SQQPPRAATLLRRLRADRSCRDHARPSRARGTCAADYDGGYRGGGVTHSGLRRSGAGKASSRALRAVLHYSALRHHRRGGVPDGLRSEEAGSRPDPGGARRMSWSWTLYRYLAIQFLVGVAIIYGAFLLLAFSIDMVDLINRTAGHNVSSGVIVGMSLLQLPDLGQKLLPFAILLGGVFSFARLSRNQEIVATRAAGLSAWDFLASPLVVAVMIGVFTVVVFTPISARL